MKNLSLSLLLCAILIVAATAQDKPDIKFNHVEAADFSTTNFKVDTSYGAVVVADIGKSSFEGNTKGWFSLIYKHQRRIKIINKKGFDLASVEIPLYISSRSNDEEVLDALKASTYNLEDGKVVEVKLDKASVFKDNQDKNHVVKKFTMPAVKEGSIIEYSYTIKSDFLFNLQPWAFQGSYPRVWSEYEVDIPSFFEYVFLAQGYNPFDINTKKNSYASYRVISHGEDLTASSETFSISSNNTITRWVIKNVPALKLENYTSSLSNHISKIEFQMSGQQFPNTPHRDFMGNWYKLSEELLKDEDFGERLSKDNIWLNDDMKVIRAGVTDRLEQLKKIYSFVKTNFKCKGVYGIKLTTSMKETFRTKSGYAEDINLLLAVMLKHENFDVRPVLLSTRSNGFANEYYPLINRLNYVVCEVGLDGKKYYLDASQPAIGFNKLPDYCYNGPARVIDETTPRNIYFSADSIREKKLTSIMLFNDDKKPGKWSGNLNTTFGYFESCNLREKFLDNGKEEFEKKLKESYTGDFSIEDIKYTDEKNYDNTMSMSHSINVESEGDANIIYFNPMLKEGYKENIFKSTERKYPVEMPYVMEETYIFQIEIPVGYVVDEIPKSAKVTLNDNEGFFEYLVTKSNDGINLRSKIKLNKAIFLPEDYETLRNFFDYVVKKQAEQIVFKKK